jgi:flagellar assembly factor FliW
MMTIESREYGTVEISERQQLYFPQGILGFEEYKRYALLDAHKKPYLILQSLDDVDVAFILIKPELFRHDYDPGLSEDDLDIIALAGPEDKLIFAIVTIPARGGNISVNLQGPIIINKKDLLGVQCISPKEEYRIRHDLIEEFGRARESV